MAQAARLSLRMQKELKLLLTDPPPGASFPLLTGADNGASSSDSSLSAIDAEIEGPEGTVYEGGIFRIKIQIPERYPFQPPIVTFATPIYHPNIDNGGRICLDILNLPPKGAWQPSLNISTVITSIGLLLSEPNPDDGLMCEVSKEYKYNRQAFNLKARTMTERNAKPGCSTMSETNQSISSTSNMDLEKAAAKFENERTKCTEGHRKPLTNKLSLDSSSLITSAAKGDHGVGEVKYGSVNPSSVVYETEKDKPPCNSGKRTFQQASWYEESKPFIPRRTLSLNCSELTKREHDSTSAVANPQVSSSSSLSGSTEILAEDGSQSSESSPQVSYMLKPNSKKSATAKGDHGVGEVKYESVNPSSVVYETEKDKLPCNSGKRTIQQASWSEESKPCIPRRKLSLNCSELTKREHDSTSAVASPQVSSSSLSGSTEILAEDGSQSQSSESSPQVSYMLKPNSKKFATGRKLSLGLSVRALHSNQKVNGKENLNPVSVARSVLEASQSSKKSPSLSKDEHLDRELGNEKVKSAQLLAIETVDEPREQGRDASQHRNASPSGLESSSFFTPRKNNSGDKHTFHKSSGAQKEKKPESPAPASVIVLDSDESDEETNVCRRSRLSVSRKRIASKGTNSVNNR